MLQQKGLLLVACQAISVWPRCFEPTPAFPVPSWESNGKELSAALSQIDIALADLANQGRFNTSSYSIEVTSASESLWSSHHTARVQNETRPGTKHVDEQSQYRIASITKVFTTLAILHLHDAGKLSLDDPVSWYIAEFNASDFVLPWKDISLRSLASQLSGIPREFAQGDLLNIEPDPTRLGLPPVSDGEGFPTCDEYNGYERACNRRDFMDRLRTFPPLFAPNQKSTYSNLNYEILGLVIADVTGEDYEDYIQRTIITLLSMDGTSFKTPSDEHAVLPVLQSGESNYWDVQEGVQSPTGGLYSSTSDMSAFLRYIITHYNTLATGVNWFMPSSWATGIQSFYGMPWEIYRAEALQHTRRPVTFVTKSGGLPGYYSKIYLLEEYGLGITILVAGSSDLLSELQEILTVAVVNAAEELVMSEINKSYTGEYVSVDETINSSIILSSSLERGLHLTAFISNGTDVLNDVLPGWGVSDTRQHKKKWYARLVPTLLFTNETARDGEVWLVQIVHERGDESAAEKVWEESCVTDIDGPLYAGKRVNELNFWREAGLVELPAWNATLRMVDRSGERRLVVQN